MKEVERISNTNLMPSYLKRKQFIADSTRAYFYFNLRKDSSYIKKYLRGYSTKEKKPVKATQPVKVKIAEETVNSRNIQTSAGTPSAHAFPDGKIIHIKRPPRKADTIWISDDKYLKNQASR